MRYLLIMFFSAILKRTGDITSFCFNLLLIINEGNISLFTLARLLVIKLLWYIPLISLIGKPEPLKICHSLFLFILSYSTNTILCKFFIDTYFFHNLIYDKYVICGLFVISKSALVVTKYLYISSIYICNFLSVISDSTLNPVFKNKIKYNTY